MTMDRWLASTYVGMPEDVARLHFGGAELGNTLRSRRLEIVAAAMLARPGASIPNACSGNSAMTAAYRFMSNPHVQAPLIIQPHTRVVREYVRDCGAVVLAVQDHTELSFGDRQGMKGIGKISGEGRGLLQHSTLAVSEGGEILGVLDVRWATRVDRKALRRKETLRERQNRWSESELWSEAAQAIGNGNGWSTRLVHVADRGGDVFGCMDSYLRMEHGFVVRAQFDRWLVDEVQLWPKLLAYLVVCRMTVPVRRNLGSGAKCELRQQRQAQVSVRYAPIHIPSPQNDPRTAGHPGILLWAVLVREENPPEGEEALEWMLLSSEAVSDEASALRVIGWYRCRWVIEEWHRALKEGLRLEESKLDDGADIRRLSAILSVQAVQLMVLRGLADVEQPAAEQAAVKRVIPFRYLEVVAAMAGVAVAKLSGTLFWRTLALRGGWPGRKSDGRPGWKVLWRGWRELLNIAQLLDAMEDQKPV